MSSGLISDDLTTEEAYHHLTRHQGQGAQRNPRHQVHKTSQGQKLSKIVCWQLLERSCSQGCFSQVFAEKIAIRIHSLRCRYSLSFTGSSWKNRIKPSKYFFELHVCLHQRLLFVVLPLMSGALDVAMDLRWEGAAHGRHADVQAHGSMMFKTKHIDCMTFVKFVCLSRSRLITVIGEFLGVLAWCSHRFSWWPCQAVSQRKCTTKDSSSDFWYWRYPCKMMQV